ncbi:hypothetical protein QR685DRAFT_490617 [Neurospora intermedia]|uniref:Uncharacterized protein n=1 Tax=Neurospora intermedia TaxID=5142 RepID=A0ABR3DJ62_NEUIN
MTKYPPSNLITITIPIQIMLRPSNGDTAHRSVLKRIIHQSSSALEPSPVELPLFVDPAIAGLTIGAITAKVMFHVGVARGE